MEQHYNKFSTTTNIQDLKKNLQFVISSNEQAKSTIKEDNISTPSNVIEPLDREKQKQIEEAQEINSQTQQDEQEHNQQVVECQKSTEVSEPQDTQIAPIQPLSQTNKFKNQTNQNIFKDQTNLFFKSLNRALQIENHPSLRAEFIESLLKIAKEEEFQIDVPKAVTPSGCEQIIAEHEQGSVSTNKQIGHQDFTHLKDPAEFQYRYEAYHMIEKIAQLSDQQFNKVNYMIQNKIGEFVSLIKTRIIYKDLNLKYLNLLLPYMEFLNLRVLINVNEINRGDCKQAYIQLFNNIENKLQRLEILERFVIISDNEDIYNSQSAQLKENDIENLTAMGRQQGMDVIGSYRDFTDIQEIPIRSLFLQSWYQKLELKNPQLLISASLSKTQIINLNECTNLRNLYSESNTYTYENVCNLNLVRLYSNRDCYTGRKINESMLDIIIQNSKIEYICVHNGYNILNELSLQQGDISNLRFFQQTSYRQISIQLNVNTLLCNEYVPSKLRFFNNCYYDENEEYMKKLKLQQTDNDNNELPNWISNKIEYDINIQKKQIKPIGIE